MNETQNEIAEAEWWKLLRRAVGIPDIVTETSNLRLAMAKRYLGLYLAAADLERLPREQLLGAVRDLEGFAKAGAAGKFDDYLASEDPPDTVKKSAVAAIFDVGGGVYNENLGNAILDTTTAYLTRHPFVDDCGHPFD